MAICHETFTLSRDPETGRFTTAKKPQGRKKMIIVDIINCT